VPNTWLASGNKSVMEPGTMTGFPVLSMVYKKYPNWFLVPPLLRSSRVISKDPLSEVKWRFKSTAFF
jgi:hypothetical protein